MEQILTAQLLCSTGLAFFWNGAALLVDVLNGSYGSFRKISEEDARRVIYGFPPFERTVGIVYSHLHPDHYDQASNQAFLSRHRRITTFFPTSETPDHGILRAGEFTVEYQYLEHTPCDYQWAKHYVFLISAGGVSVYLTTDAALHPEQHEAFLGRRHVDYAFFNAMYLSYPETRRLMRRIASKTYIYHMPEPATDRSGICRKAERNFQRYPDELRDVQLLCSYPYHLELPPIIL